MVVFTIIGLLSLPRILMVDSITSSHALYLLRKSLNTKIRQYQKMLQSSKIKLIGKNR